MRGFLEPVAPDPKPDVNADVCEEEQDGHGGQHDAGEAEDEKQGAHAITSGLIGRGTPCAAPTMLPVHGPPAGGESV